VRRRRRRRPAARALRRPLPAHLAPVGRLGVAEHDDRAAARARRPPERLLELLGWQGIFELELVETAEGRLAAIDFNPRPYGSMALAASAGADLAAVWCDWLLGRAPAPVRARPGLSYRWEEAEVLNLGAALRRRRFADAARILQPPRTTYAFFRLGDPGPLLARALAILRQRLDRRR
jgi:predicted ATP-grasp superfamily ATP-dependent carboligase